MRIIILSDRMTGHSAYSKVTRELCTRTAKMGHAVAHIPMGRANRMGRQVYQGVLVYESGDHAFGEDVAVNHYVDFHADMLIFLKEAWVMHDLHRWAINLVPYCPVDHSPVSTSMTSRLNTVFKVLTPSRFGQMELRKAGIESDYLPHGVNTSIYKPLENRAECRKLWFLKPDDFVLLYVGWNRARKMIPRMLRIYKRFLELNPDVKNAHFLLWTNITAETTPQETMQGVADVGVNLIPEIIELGLATPPNDVRWFDPNEWKKLQAVGGLPEWDPTGGWDMVKIFNSADVTLGLTGGEGFWLVGIESQACGTPVLVTDYASAPEIVGSGYTVPYEDYVILNTPGTRFALADIDRAAEALTKIYNGDREKMARRARTFAERYDWNRIIDRYWKPFLEDVETELYPKVSKEGVSKWI